MSTAIDQKTENSNVTTEESNNHNVEPTFKKTETPKILSYDMTTPYYQQTASMYGPMTTAGHTGTEYAGQPNTASYMAYSFQYNGGQGLGDGSGMWAGTAAQGNPAAAASAGPEMGYMGYPQNDYYSYNPYYSYYQPGPVDYDMNPASWGMTQSTAMGAAAAAAAGVNNKVGGGGGAAPYYQHPSRQHIQSSQSHPMHHLHSNSGAGDASANGDDGMRSVDAQFNRMNLAEQDAQHMQSNHQDGNKSWATVAGQQPKGSAATMTVLPSGGGTDRGGGMKKPQQMGVAGVPGGNSAGGSPNNNQSYGGSKQAPGRGTSAMGGKMSGGGMWARDDVSRGNLPQYGGQMMSRGGGGGGNVPWNQSWTSGQHTIMGPGGSSNNALLTAGDNSAGNTVSTGDQVLDAKMLDLEKSINPRHLSMEFDKARFFVIKSYSEDDIHRSIKYSIWCSTELGNRKLDEAFKEMEQTGGKVFLFFSVNGSGHFCGVAEMVSKVDTDTLAGVWCQTKWRGKFEVKWVYVKDVPNNHLRHIRLESNDNKPVTNSRDATEVTPLEKGKQVLKVIHNYKQTTSIFDDFMHYEKREQEVKRSGHNNQQH